MRILRIDPEHPDREAIARAAEVVWEGGLVAFPTETVYGLGANALDPHAVERIFAAKNRPAYNPLIVHCASLDAARGLAERWPEEAERLGQRFWPGPLTLVLPKKAIVPDRVTAGLPTVALRVPSHPVALALLAAAGVPLAAPSANRFMELSPTRAEHVLKGLRGVVDLVLDAGPTPLGIESTVVDLSAGSPVLLRPGSLDAGELANVLGVEIGKPGERSGTEARPGPGMLDRHYSPRASVVLVPRGDRERLARAAERAAAAGARIGALLLEDYPGAVIHHPVTLPSTPAGFARELYASLHELDDAGCDVILVEMPEDDLHWAGIRDRLRRAAGPS